MSLEAHHLPDHAVALGQDVELAIVRLGEARIHPASSGHRAGAGQRFTLPATRAGLYGGMLLVFLPALGDFVSAQLLGGPRTYMIGNLIQQQFAEGQNWPLGSAMTVAMMGALTVLMVVYLRATTTRTRERS